MGQNWKPIDRVREYGNQTEKVETSEFLNEEIMSANMMLDFLEIAKKFDKTIYCVCGKSDCPVYVSETEEDANNFIAQHSHYDLLHIEIVN